MNFDVTTPALIFPAISLLMLAYTNRFVVLAQLIRDLDKHYRETRSKNQLMQIANLRKRMTYIKSMQVLGALAFIIAASSMLLNMLGQDYISFIVFGFSLLPLIASLIFLLLELNMSIGALSVQIDDLEDL